MAKANTTVGGSALERSHRASLEPLAQLGDAFRGVGAVAKHVDAAELVVGQAATREGGTVSMGADRKAMFRGLVRAPSGLLQRLQGRVSLEALRESGASLGAEFVLAQTASMGADVCAEGCQWVADRKANAFGWQAHLSDLSAAADGNNLLSTIAPGTPTPLPPKESSVMLFSRKETSGIPQ